MATAEQTTSLGERVSRIECGYEHLATKADLAQLKAELQSDIAGLHGDIAGAHGDIGGLRGEIDALRGEIRGIKWWILSVGAAVVALTSLAELLPLGG